VRLSDHAQAVSTTGSGVRSELFMSVLVQLLLLLLLLLRPTLSYSYFYYSYATRTALPTAYYLLPTV